MRPHVVFGLLIFAVAFGFHAYRTIYVYPLIPRVFLIGDFLISAGTGLYAAWVCSCFLRRRQ